MIFTTALAIIKGHDEENWACKINSNVFVDCFVFWVNWIIRKFALLYSSIFFYVLDCSSDCDSEDIVVLFSMIFSFWSGIDFSFSSFSVFDSKMFLFVHYLPLDLIFPFSCLLRRFWNFHTTLSRHSILVPI